VTIVDVPYHRGWIGRTLASLERELGVRAAFVVRFGNGVLPTPDTVIQEGDSVYAAALSHHTTEIAELAAAAPEGI